MASRLLYEYPASLVPHSDGTANIPPLDGRRNWPPGTPFLGNGKKPYLGDARPVGSGVPTTKGAVRRIGNRYGNLFCSHHTRTAHDRFRLLTDFARHGKR